MASGSYVSLPVVVPANGTTDRLGHEGRFVYAVASTADFLVQLDGVGPFFRIGLQRGPILADGQTFRSVMFKNETATPITAEVVIGDGDYKDNRLEAGAVLDARPVAPNTFDSSANETINAAAQLDIAADTTRRELILTNLHASQTVYARDAAGTADEGLPIRAGATVVITTSGAVRVVNNGVANVVVAIAATKQV